MRAVQWILVVAALFAYAAVCRTIPQVHANGTHYQVGLQVGSAMKTLIRNRLTSYADLINFVQTNTYAQAFNDSLFKSTATSVPQVMEEVRGIADGCGVPIGLAWVLSCVSEFEALKGLLEGRTNETTRDGMQCSDVYTNRKFIPHWGHNEDGDIKDFEQTYLVHAKIYNETTGMEEESFTSFTYAGVVGGKAFGWNSYGIALSFNALSAANIGVYDEAAVPRVVLNRLLLKSRSFDDAIAILRQYHAPTAFSVNIGTYHIQFVDGQPVQKSFYHNINTAPMGRMAINAVPSTNKTSPALPPNAIPPRLFNFQTNNPVTLNFNFTSDKSSEWRMKRMHEFSPPETADDVRAILGDTKYPLFPVYRIGRAPDYLATLVTCIYDLAGQRALLYTANPKTTAPTLILPLYELPRAAPYYKPN